jgi:peptidoglycan/xylan/chitin deacetylase (PgdA/CDA1 family)
MIRKFARHSIIPTLRKLKIDNVINKVLGKNILQITYHGVSNDDLTMYSPRHIQSNLFEQQIKYFKQNFDIVSVKEAFELRNKKNDLKTKYLAISFDDGYLNNYTTMWPIIEQFKVPVTIFVCGSNLLAVDRPYLWPEFAENFIKNNRNLSFKFKSYNFEKLIDQSTNLDFFNWIKRQSFATRNEIFEFIEDRYKVSEKIYQTPKDVWQLMSPSQLIEISKSPLIEIGAHGHHHLNLSELAIKEVQSDLYHAKNTIQDLLGKNIDMLAYPDGSYNESVIEIARHLGYKYQLAVNYNQRSDKYILDLMNRHGVSSTTTLDSTLFFANLAFITKGH